MIRTHRRGRLLVVLAALGTLALPQAAQAIGEVNDPNLGVRVAASGFPANQLTSFAFIGPNEFLLLEKGTGRVQHVRNGALVGTALDLAVNSNSERGLLGIALDRFFFTNGRLFLYWTESSTGVDTGAAANVPTLGNRVDRFVWNGSTLTQDINLIKLRAFQQDPAGTGQLRGNHNGGVLKVSRDGRVHIIIGDTGRRGQTQNLTDGPFGPGTPDDQFGGPMPDNAHLTGVILRLNPDGTTPRFNPFYEVGAQIGGEAGANIQKILVYGIRNSFGMAFDPIGRRLWHQENGDDSFSELNLSEDGMNSGWVQIMGPASRVAQFKQIETTMGPTSDPFAPNGYFGLQQARWLPTNIADTPEQALSRLHMIPGSHFSDPELSWKYEMGPGGMGFMDGDGLGEEYNGDLFMGGSRNFFQGGHIFKIELTRNRKAVDVSADPRLADLVADNTGKWEGTESESMFFGRNFGLVTDIQTGPNGNLFVVSNTDGAVYEIYRK